MYFKPAIISQATAVYITVLLVFIAIPTCAQSARISILKDPSYPIKSLSHFIFEQFYKGDKIEEETHLIFEVDEQIPYYYIVESDSIDWLLYIPSDVEAEIKLNGEFIEIISSNSPEFDGYVAFQNFFRKHFTSNYNSAVSALNDFMQRLPEIDSAYLELKADFSTHFGLSHNFLTFLDIEYKYRKMRVVKAYLIYNNKSFGQVNPDFPDRVIRGEKHRRKLNKYLKRNYPIEVDLGKNQLSPAFIEYISDIFMEDIFSGPKSMKRNAKRAKALMEKGATQFNELYQSLILLSFLNVYSDSEWLRRQPLYSPFITHSGVQYYLQSRREYIKSEKRQFAINYIHKERERDMVSAGSAIEGLNGFIEANKGKVIFIDFWTTWCSPCVANFPYSNKIEEELKGENIVFLYVCMDAHNNSEGAIELIKKYNLGGNHIVLEDKKVGGETVKSKFNIRSYPTYKIIDTNGAIFNLDTLQPQMGDGTLLKNELLKVLKN